MYIKKLLEVKNAYKGIVFWVSMIIGLFIVWIVYKNIKIGSDFNSQDYVLNKESLRITFLDAGKADAIILHTNNSTVLIDAGLKSGGKELVEFLNNEGITIIDYMIITHFDKDHVGGAAKVIKKFKVNNIISSDYFKDSDAVRDYLKACDEVKIIPNVIENNISFTLDNITYTIYPHIASTYSEKESNNSSLIISVKHGENRMLFTGDANNLRMEEFLTKQEKNFKYQLLKVPYHGRYMECLSEFFKTIKPEYAVITSSEEDKEDKETVQLLEQVGAKVLLTRKGNITVVSDGKRLTVEQ